MEFITARSIAGKFFINHLHARSGAGILMRGRVVGPIANELSPFYLCEVFPANDTEIGITTETVMQLEQLVGVYFYATREQQQAAWIETQRQILVQQQAALKQRKQMVAGMVKQLVTAFQRRGVKIVERADLVNAAEGMMGAIEQTERAGVQAAVEMVDVEE